VVAYPVENRVRECGVHGFVELQFRQVGLEDRRAPGVERLARVLDHRRRGVHGHHVTARQPLEQQLGHPPGSASGIEHGLVAAQRKPLQDLERPFDLRRRDSVVRGGVPVAAHAVAQAAG
jgi:hypothetical protein